MPHGATLDQHFKGTKASTLIPQLMKKINNEGDQLTYKIETSAKVSIIILLYQNVA
jgi:hypothetical protein